MANVLLGVSGGIAAYKTPECVRQFIQMGFAVRVVMTQAAESFVTALTLETVSQQQVFTSMWSTKEMDHIDLARWADVILIAPATTNIIAKLTHGVADDLLSTLCISTTKPIIIAPAMNREMWASETTQANIKQLQQRGVQFVGPDKGEQACGEVGWGRMVNPDELVAEVVSIAQSFSGILKDKKIMITAGATREFIDSIRFLSNRSTGRMGYALAQLAKNVGADVTLVTGPTSLIPPNVNVVPVTSAHEMYEAVMSDITNQDIFISTAAVADYTIANPSKTKVKKSCDEMELKLTRTQDILRSVGELENRPYCVGFAAEDENLIDNAKAKLKSKNCDMIVANKISDSFEQETNRVVIIKGDEQVELPEQSKRATALAILDFCEV